MGVSSSNSIGVTVTERFNWRSRVLAVRGVRRGLDRRAWRLQGDQRSIRLRAADWTEQGEPGAEIVLLPVVYGWPNVKPTIGWDSVPPLSLRPRKQYYVVKALLGIGSNAISTNNLRTSWTHGEQLLVGDKETMVTSYAFRLQELIASHSGHDLATHHPEARSLTAKCVLILRATPSGSRRPIFSAPWMIPAGKTPTSFFVPSIPPLRGFENTRTSSTESLLDSASDKSSLTW